VDRENAKALPHGEGRSEALIPGNVRGNEKNPRQLPRAGAF